MSAYSATLTKDEMVLTRNAFERYDTDANGTVAIENLSAALAAAKRQLDDAELTRIIEDMGLGDGSSGLRFHEFLTLVEGTERQPVQQTSVEDDDALNSSFQWLGGNLEDPESSVDKSRIAEVLKDFELSADVDEVLGAPATAGSPDRVLKQNLSLTDFKQAFSGAQESP
jgi:Ca2+-binding EF-hand superfamily protein